MKQQNDRECTFQKSHRACKNFQLKQGLSYSFHFGNTKEPSTFIQATFIQATFIQATFIQEPHMATTQAGNRDYLSDDPRNIDFKDLEPRVRVMQIIVAALAVGVAACIAFMIARFPTKWKVQSWLANQLG